MPSSCSKGCIAASEGHTGAEDDIRKRRALSAANDRLTTLRLLFELFMTGVADGDDIPTVLLQGFEHGDKRAMKLRIMLLNLFRDQGALYLHLQYDSINHLHKIGRTRRER